MSSPLRKVASLLIAGAVWTGSVRPTPAAEDARAILVEADNRSKSQAQEYLADITVKTRSGGERHMVSQNYVDGYGASANRLIRFLAPPDLRGVGYLAVSRPGQLPDRWMYLPSMKRERRIAAQEQGSAFVGTDFSYEDLQDQIDPSRYDASLLRDQVIDGQPCYAIELTPRDRSGYSKKVAYLRKDLLNLVRTEYYKAPGSAMAKRLEFFDFVAIDRYRVARRVVMSDVQKGSQTTVVLSNIAFNQPQTPGRFTIQNLIREDAGRGGLAMSRKDAQSRRAREAGFQGQAPAAPETGATPSLGGAGFTGFVEALGVAFGGKATDRDDRGSLWTTALLRQTVSIGRVRLLGSVRAQSISWPTQGRVRLDLADRQVARSPLSFRELQATIRVAPTVDVDVGRFETSWSWNDGYSPADAFLPRDATDPFADERLPLWGVRLQGDQGRFRFEGYASFLTTPWRLPQMDGRYSPFSGARIYVLGASEPAPTRAFQMGRIVRSGEHWDVGAWVRAGVRPAPILSTTDEITLPVDTDTFVTTHRRFADERAAGIELSRDFNGWMVRGEAGVYRSRDETLGDAVIVSLEAQRLARTGALTFTLAGNLQPSPSDPLLLFDRAYLPAFIIGVTQLETWGTWEVRCLGTFRQVGGVLKAEAARRITDSTKLVVSTYLPYGTPVDSPGAFANARQARASIRWSW